ncbi:peptide deformylase [Escherichia coli]
MAWRQCRSYPSTIIVIDVSENRDERLVLINPELLEKSGETGIEEGCLWIPEQRALVPRAEKVKIRALDRDGKIIDWKQTVC